ncbi:TetR/AcrR family transcriptional regulator [Solibacillus sp. FSL K6-1523]|uniref:TetR/AcrR family transcriptional regulator n=1 Tax=Solibacillus sp. FSL K6-1523 TaxID=2921471 RepID=UPI0030F8CAD6
MEKTMDPRTVRTRKLIVEAFNQLIISKSFEQITVKDITEQATINRATFYAHFVDKYALLEEVLSERIEQIFTENLQESPNRAFTEDMIVQMFLAIVCVHDQMFSQCRRGYTAFTQMIDDKVKDYLLVTIEKHLPEEQKLQAVLISWGLYGSYVAWDKQKNTDAKTFAKQVAGSLLMLT